jgi:hypothetical protein
LNKYALEKLTPISKYKIKDITNGFFRTISIDKRRFGDA